MNSEILRDQDLDSARQHIERMAKTLLESRVDHFGFSSDTFTIQVGVNNENAFEIYLNCSPNQEKRMEFLMALSAMLAQVGITGASGGHKYVTVQHGLILTEQNLRHLNNKSPQEIDVAINRALASQSKSSAISKKSSDGQRPEIPHESSAISKESSDDQPPEIPHEGVSSNDDDAVQGSKVSRNDILESLEWEKLESRIAVIQSRKNNGRQIEERNNHKVAAIKKLKAFLQSPPENLYDEITKTQCQDLGGLTIAQAIYQSTTSNPHTIWKSLVTSRPLLDAILKKINPKHDEAVCKLSLSKKN